MVDQLSPLAAAYMVAGALSPRGCSKMLSKEQVSMPQRSRAYRGYQLQLRQLVPAACTPISSDGVSIVASRGCLVIADDEWREEA